MKRIFIGVIVSLTLILTFSVNTFGLVQLNVEDAVNGKVNGKDYTELSLSGNVVVPVVGIKIDAEYDTLSSSDGSGNQYMAGAGFRVLKLSGFSLFVGGEIMGFSIGTNTIGALMCDASLTWRVNGHISVDAWMGNSLVTTLDGISTPGLTAFAYRGRFTYWIIQNVGVSSGIHGTAFQAGVPGTDLNFNAMYLGAAFGL